MTVRRIAVLATLLLSLTGCATTTQGSQATTTRAETLACNELPQAVASAEVFDAPLTVVDAKPVYRYEGRMRRRVPEGVRLSVRAEQGLSAPDVHRMVACRMDRGSETRIGVRATGATYQVTVVSSRPEVARAIQAEHAPTAL